MTSPGVYGLPGSRLYIGGIWPSSMGGCRNIGTKRGILFGRWSLGAKTGSVVVGLMLNVIRVRLEE